MRVDVVSDIHGNLAALQAVLADAGQVQALWCLGDIVGYGPEPDNCVQTIRTFPHAAVAGNHEWACLGKLSTAEFNLEAAAAVRWTIGQLSAETREFLEVLPQRRVEGDFTLVHGSPRNPMWEYLVSARGAGASFSHFNTKYCLVGHTHIPSYFVQQGGEIEAAYADANHQLDLEGPNRLILNPGSVGQPRDNNPLASYVLLDTEGRTALWRRVPYDVSATQELMARHGLPRRLIERLSSGW